MFAGGVTSLYNPRGTILPVPDKGGRLNGGHVVRSAGVNPGVAQPTDP